jgi:3-hydroxybutyryl-CoA dehydratase
MIGVKSIDGIRVGDSACLSKIISELDVLKFAEASGDSNPVHIDQEFASCTRFGRRVAHGVLVAGLISAVLGMQLPGPGCIYLSQTLQFRMPVYLGDTITAIVEVIKVRDDKPIITLRTVCANQDEQVVIEGEAVMLVPA